MDPKMTGSAETRSRAERCIMRAEHLVVQRGGVPGGREWSGLRPTLSHTTRRVLVLAMRNNE